MNNSHYKKNYHFTSEWFTEENIHNWEKIFHPFKSKRTNYLEIGVYEGRSLLWMVENILLHPESKAIGIDEYNLDRYDYKSVLHQNINLSGERDKVTIIGENSQIALRAMKDDSIDVIYIDGSHEMKNVTRDIINSWYLLKEGGILILDDYGMHKDRMPTFLRPELAINNFLIGFRNEIDTLLWGYQIILQKKAALGGSSCSMIDEYSYEWYNHELYNIKTERIYHLTDDKRLLLEAMLRGINYLVPDEELVKQKQEIKALLDSW